MTRIGRSTAEIAIALIIMGACVAVFRFAVVFPIQHLVGTDSLAITTFRRVGTLTFLALGYWIARRHLDDSNRIVEMRWRAVPALVGAGSGAALIGLPIVVLFATGHYAFVSLRGMSALPDIVLLIAVTALAEEFLFRGVGFRAVERHFGTFVALVVVSAAFGALHLLNDGATGMTVISVSLLSALWTLVFVLSRNLWVVGFHHAAWNLTIFMSGVPLSGQERWRVRAPIESTYHGPDWLTGGAFGPEDSVVTILLVAFACFATARAGLRRGWRPPPCPRSAL